MTISLWYFFEALAVLGYAAYRIGREQGYDQGRAATLERRPYDQDGPE